MFIRVGGNTLINLSNAVAIADAGNGNVRIIMPSREYVIPLARLPDACGPEIAAIKKAGGIEAFVKIPTK